MSEAQKIMDKCCLSKCKGHRLQAENKDLREALEKINLRERADDIWAFQKEGELKYDQRQSIKRFSSLLHDAAKIAEQALKE